MTRAIVTILALFSTATIAGTAAGQTTATRKGPTITASPNPVPSNPDVRGTTIAWTTADGSDGTVRVSMNGGPEQLFAEGPSGSTAADWIDATGVFEFRLYASDDPRTVLASVNVTREPAGPRVDVNPNPVEPGPGLATVTITWTTGDQSDGEVHISRNGEAERLFARGPSGSAQANWIVRTAAYDFTLYSVAQPRRRLAGVRLAPAAAMPPGDQAPASRGARDIATYLIWLAVVVLFGFAMVRRLWKPSEPGPPER